MPNERPQLIRFVLHARRALILRELLRRVEICGVASSAAALGIAGIFLYCGLNSRPLTLLILLAGVACGLVWSAARRVSPLAAAEQIDREFQTNDLLATAWPLRHDSSSSWSNAVVAMAEDRCGEMELSLMRFAKPNGGRWGAIALCSMAAITLGLWPVTPKAEGRVALGGAESTFNLPAEGVRLRPAASANIDEDSDRPAASDVETAMDVFAPTGRAKGDSATPGESDSAGSGLSRTNMANSHSPETFTSAIPDSKPPSIGGVPAGGIGHAAAGGSPGDAGGQSTDAHGVNPLPWQTAGWPQARAEALKSLDERSVDPAYSPMVRDYFLHQ